MAAAVAVDMECHVMIEVRVAERRQMALVCRLEARCFGIERVLYGQWQRVGAPGVETLIAYVNAAAAGFLISYPHDIDAISCPYVAALGVVPQHRRIGVAHALLRTMLLRYGAAWLHVRASNASAIALYAAMCFTIVRRVRAYYRDGEDALLMRTTVLQASD
jgi:ribosomal-protein-alanine N-acetyltransferase